MKYLIATGLAAASLCLGGAALAEYPTDKEISFVIPYSPGGGFDTIVRQFAPPLEEAMGTTVIPENISGAGGTRGAASVHRSEPDGYTIGIYNIPGFTVNEITGRDQGFALSEVTWLANIAVATYGLAVKADGPDTVEELCAGDSAAKFSDTGATSTASVTTRISMALIGCEIVDVTGYKGSSDAMVAVISGEVDATIKPISSLAKYTEGGSGDLKLILTLTEERVIDGVASASDIGHPELAKFTLNRVIGGPPGIPADVVAKLEAGLKAASESDAVTRWADGAGVTIDFKGAEATKAMMDDLSTFYEQYKDLVAMPQ